MAAEERFGRRYLTVAEGPCVSAASRVVPRIFIRPCSLLWAAGIFCFIKIGAFAPLVQQGTYYSETK